MEDECNYPDEVEIFVRRFRPALPSRDGEALRPSGPYGFLARARGSYTPQSQSGKSISRPKPGRVSFVETDFKRLLKGTTFHLPWSEALVVVSLVVRVTLGSAISDLGTAHIPVEVFRSGLKKVVLDVTDSGDVVGQLWVDIAFRQIVSHVDASKLHGDILYEGGLGKDLGSDCNSTHSRRVLGRRSHRAAFRFDRLSRRVDWDRVRSVDVNKVIKYTDISSVMSLVDMVKYGDVSGEEIDPKFQKALNVAQYMAQYLDGGRQMLVKKESIIEGGIRMFDEEEQMLDIELAKYRSRFKALNRELEDLDALEQKYMKLLNQLDPTWAQRVQGTNDGTPFLSSAMAREKGESSRDKRVLADVSNTFILKNMTSDTVPEGSIKLGRTSLYEPQNYDRNIIAGPDIPSCEEPLQLSSQLKTPIALKTEVEIPKVKVTTLSASPVASSVIQSIDSLNGTGEFSSTVGSDKAFHMNETTKQDVEKPSNDVWRPAEVRKVVRVPLQVQIVSYDDIIQDISGESTPCATAGTAATESQHVSSFQEASVVLDEPDDSSLNQSRHPGALYISESAVSENLPADILKPEHPIQISLRSANEMKAAFSDDLRFAKPSEQKESATMKGSNLKKSADTAEAKGLVRPSIGSSAKDRKQSDKPSMDSRSLELHDELFGIGGTAHVAETKHQAPSDGEDEGYSEDSYSREDLTPSLSVSQRTDFSKPNATQSDLDSTTSSIPIPGLEHSLENFGGLDTGLIRQRVLLQSGARASDNEDGVLFGTTSVNPGALDLSDDNHAYKDFDESLQSQGENSYGDNSKPLYDSNEDIGTFIPSLTAYEPPSPPALKNLDHDFDQSNEAHERSVESSLVGSSAADMSSMEGLSKRFTDQYIQKALEENCRLLERQAEAPAEPQQVAPVVASPTSDVSKVSWTSGRAPMELIETAQAMDAYVSSLRLDGASLLALGISQIYLRFNFMNANSAASSIVNVNLRSSYVQMPISFGARFEALSEEIQFKKEDLSLQIVIFGATVADDGEVLKESVIGVAIVNLWYMIEDSCGIVMQEVDVTDAEGVGVVGAVVIDVRGHHALIDSSA